jgi:hypothetical protein
MTQTEVEDNTLLHFAVANNAAWCDAVCRTHGINGEFSQETWASSTRTPALYPDAVTLRAEIDVESMLAKIDTSPGCTIKDSFATCDLRPYGFTVLFDATWLSFRPSQSKESGSSSRWISVTTANRFRDWEVAWRGASGPVDVLTPTLLDDDRVSVFAHYVGEQIVSGLICFVSDSVLSISNAFDTEGDLGFLARSFDLLVLPAEALIVGYESGRDLDAVRNSIATELGPLRIWIKTE